MYSWGIGRYGQLGQGAYFETFLWNESVRFLINLGNVATVAKPEYIDLDFAYFNKKKAPFGFTDSLDSSNGDEEDGMLLIAICLHCILILILMHSDCDSDCSSHHQIRCKSITSTQHCWKRSVFSSATIARKPLSVNADDSRTGPVKPLYTNWWNNGLQLSMRAWCRYDCDWLSEVEWMN